MMMMLALDSTLS